MLIFQNSNVLVISRFRLQGKTRKMFDTIVSTKSDFYISILGGEPPVCTPPPPLWVCACCAVRIFMANRKRMS
jgi:hypothetical protein